MVDPSRWLRRATRTGMMAAICGLLIGASTVFAQQPGPVTGLPLPRFVSLKSSQVNVRVGPGSNYPIEWTYVRFGLPVEITQEFDNWRRVRDSSGNEGWVLWNLLSGDRSVVVLPAEEGEPLAVRAEPIVSARVVARLEDGVVAAVDRCEEGWCRLTDSRFSGWVEQDRIWGVYPDETFD